MIGPSFDAVVFKQIQDILQAGYQNVACAPLLFAVVPHAQSNAPFVTGDHGNALAIGRYGP
jgi:hypothetical protein